MSGIDPDRTQRIRIQEEVQSLGLKPILGHRHMSWWDRIFLKTSSQKLHLTFSFHVSQNFRKHLGEVSTH